MTRGLFANKRAEIFRDANKFLRVLQRVRARNPRKVGLERLCVGIEGLC